MQAPSTLLCEFCFAQIFVPFDQFWFNFLARVTNLRKLHSSASESCHTFFLHVVVLVKSSLRVMLNKTDLCHLEWGYRAVILGISKLSVSQCTVHVWRKTQDVLLAYRLE